MSNSKMFNDKLSKAERTELRRMLLSTSFPTLSEELFVRSTWKRVMFEEHVNSAYFDFDYPRTEVMIREILENCSN